MFGHYAPVTHALPGHHFYCTDNRTELQLRKNHQYAGTVTIVTMLQYNQLKQRNRSRSGSSLVSVGGQQRQLPLVSHASDPALATPNPPPPPPPAPSSSTTSTLQPLLAQLLTSEYFNIKAYFSI